MAPTAINSACHHLATFPPQDYHRLLLQSMTPGRVGPRVRVRVSKTLSGRSNKNRAHPRHTTGPLVRFASRQSPPSHHQPPITAPSHSCVSSPVVRSLCEQVSGVHPTPRQAKIIAQAPQRLPRRVSSTRRWAEVSLSNRKAGMPTTPL